MAGVVPNWIVPYLKSEKWHYTIERDEDGYFIGIVQMDGCLAFGETLSDAYDNLKDAMESWLMSRKAAELSLPEIPA